MNMIAAKWRQASRALHGIKSERAFRKRVINVGHLIAGNFGAVFVSLGAVAFAARALGPSHYGMLALVTVFIQAIERFVSFQTWQPIIKYGAALDAPDRRRDLKALIKFGFLLDLFAAALSWSLASGLSIFGAKLFGWDSETLKLSLIYAMVLLFAINGTPIGILRLAGKFRAAAYVQVAAMSVRLCLCAAAYFLDWGLRSFVIIWTVTHILGALLLIIAASLELREKKLLDFFSEPLGKVSERFPNIWRFSLVANFSVTIRATAQQLDTLLVGALVDPASAGFYHIAKRVAKFAQQAGSQIQAVVFPEVAKMWADRDYENFKRTVLQSELLLAGLGVAGIFAMVFIADPLVRTFVGDEFAPAAKLLIIQIVAVALILSGSVTRAALLSMGKENAIFVVSFASTAVFFGSAYFLIQQMGAMGANVAHILLGLVWVIGLWLYFYSAFRRGAANAADKISALDQTRPARGHSEKDNANDGSEK